MIEHMGKELHFIIFHDYTPVLCWRVVDSSAILVERLVLTTDHDVLNFFPKT